MAVHVAMYRAFIGRLILALQCLCDEVMNQKPSISHRVRDKHKLSLSVRREARLNICDFSLQDMLTKLPVLPPLWRNEANSFSISSSWMGGVSSALKFHKKRANITALWCRSDRPALGKAEEKAKVRDLVRHVSYGKSYLICMHTLIIFRFYKGDWTRPHPVRSTI